MRSTPKLLVTPLIVPAVVNKPQHGAYLPHQLNNSTILWFEVLPIKDPLLKILVRNKYIYLCGLQDTSALQPMILKITKLFELLP